MLPLYVVNNVINTQPVKSQSSGAIYIRSDGSVEPSTAPIHRDGDVYTFTKNIYDPIVVERDNVVVDGAGYTLQGNGSGDGINVEQKRVIDGYYNSTRNVTIKNMQINNFGHGILLNTYTSSNTISGNTITNCKWSGISLSWSSYNIITGNNITNDAVGIELQGASNNSIVGNYITQNGDGISLGNAPLGVYYCSSLYNSFFYNSFMNNTWQVYDYMWGYPKDANLLTNMWDNGTAGNYWGHYTGDTPYIPDRHPLMKPVVAPLPHITPPKISPPKIAVVSPENKTYPMNNVPLTFIANKPASALAWMCYSLDTKTKIEILGNITLTGVPNGFHSLTVYAADPYGYMGVSETIHFTIAQPSGTTPPPSEGLPPPKGEVLFDETATLYRFDSSPLSNLGDRYFDFNLNLSQGTILVEVSVTGPPIFFTFTQAGVDASLLSKPSSSPTSSFTEQVVISSERHISYSLGEYQIWIGIIYELMKPNDLCIVHVRLVKV
jgi:parallel beta-helix repeat protein